jgi:hypothetical protein
VLTPAWTRLRHHPVQAKLWRTRARFPVVCAGRGSGKTELARRRVVRMLPVRKSWPDPLYFYALPTVNQARRVAWGAIKKLVPRDWLRGDPHESDMRIETVFGSTLLVVGLDKPMRVEGVQYDGGVIDESSDQKPGSFALNIGPALTHRYAWVWRIGVPKRHGSGAREFKAAFDLGLSGADPEVESYSWPSEDILSPEQLRFFQETLDPRDYREQYQASWEQAGGLVFYAYDDTLNVSERAQYDSSRPICVGSDFNVDPMAWVLAHVVGREVHVFEEVFARNTNTPATLDYLHRKYAAHATGWEFYGDAAGKSRHTSASVSDYLHIKNDRRFAGARVFYPDSNPGVVDRFAACNAMFLNAAGERRCVVNPRCRHLRRDLQERVWKEGAREPDDYGDVGHVTDALGYLMHRRFPVVARVEGGLEMEIRT